MYYHIRDSGIGGGTRGTLGDDLADNYISFDIYTGSTTVTHSDRIGYNRGETVIPLMHETNIDNGQARSLHLIDDSTSYQNTSGSTAYVIMTLNSVVGSTRKQVKVWSSPNNDSVTGATEVWDSNDHTVDTSGAGWTGTNDKFTTHILPIQNNHYIVIENNTGVVGQSVEVLGDDSGPADAIVIEQAP